MKKYINYSDWKYGNETELKTKYREWIKSNYRPVEPDTYQSFDDFCMGQWQFRDCY